MFKNIAFNTIITRKDIQALTEKVGMTCVSLFIPTHRSGFDNEKIDRLTFRNAIGDARSKLEKQGVDPNELHGFLQPAYDLLENERYWTHLSDGLAVFIGPELLEYFEVPISFKPFVYVGQEFYLRPLMPMFTGDGRFFLLALSQNQVRFFEGSRHSITPVTINDVVPDNMEETLVFEDGESILQGRTDVPRYGSTRYHGHGQSADAWEKQIKKYFREVDDGLMSFLHDEDAPMIIATVDHLFPIYRELSNYSNIVDLPIKGNPEQTSPVLLHEKAWNKMAPYFRARQKEAFDQFGEARAHGRASRSVAEIVPAAINGKVEALFIDRDAHDLWGFYNITRNEVAIQEERKGYSTCLLNLAAVRTFLQGGKVYNVSAEEMPDHTSLMNAIFRY